MKRTQRARGLKVLSQRDAERVAGIIILGLFAAFVLFLYQACTWAVEHDNNKYEQRAGGTRS